MQPTYDEVLDELSDEEAHMLEVAHSRYLLFAGIIDPETSEENDQAITDRNDYPHYFKDGGDIPVYVDDYCVGFMASISGLPVVWCQAWNDKDLEEVSGYKIRQKSMCLH